MIFNIELPPDSSWKWTTSDPDRRTPFIESRRKFDCFPDGGAVAITIAAFSFISFCLGFVLGKWVF